MHIIIIIIVFLLNGCEDTVLNNPYDPAEKDKKIIYSSFSTRPKTLDPSISYSSNEAIFISQVYEPVIQYHYLKRPFALVPLTSVSLPEITYYNDKDEIVEQDGRNRIKYSVYTIKIKPNILYQPHPAFAKDQNDQYIYHNVDEDIYEALSIEDITDFKNVSTRELIADDYVYAIKRLAHPMIKSPIYGVMAKHIIGFSDLGKNLVKNPQVNDLYQSLSKSSIDGVELIDRYTFKIKIQEIYPQFMYWLAMNFFSPIPWEGDVFYDNEYLKDHNLTFAWYPIGTGPYMLTENNPNSRMVLTKNPNFHGEKYPKFGSPGDYKNGLLEYSDKQLPLVEQVVYSLEKETVPRWSKFLQGYYDFSSISSDSFDEAIRINADGKPNLTDKLLNKGLILQTSVAPTIFYIGFNMRDKVVGGNDDRARNLRQAISIVIDFEEYISIFLNGRGTAATGPVPSIILQDDIFKNEYIYNYVDRKRIRKTIKYAMLLLEKAGYKNGIDPKTREPLILNFDTAISGSADDKERFNWMRKQFRKIGISLNIQATHYNRFQDKLRDGNIQMFMSGWHADYPDPENFLFLFYSKNSRAIYGGENYSNYNNKDFDLLFEKMQYTPSKELRNKLAIEMIKILQYEHPWVWGFYPRTYLLSHQWNNKSKSSEIAYNTLKYKDINIELRNNLRKSWNVPNLWPILILFTVLMIFLMPVFIVYRNKKYKPRYRK